MNAREIKLQNIENRYLELTDLLISDEVIANPKLLTKYAKEQASITEAYETYQKYKIKY